MSQRMFPPDEENFSYGEYRGPQPEVETRGKLEEIVVNQENPFIRYVLAGISFVVSLAFSIIAWYLFLYPHLLPVTTVPIAVGASILAIVFYSFAVIGAFKKAGNRVGFLSLILGVLGYLMLQNPSIDVKSVGFIAIVLTLFGFFVGNLVGFFPESLEDGKKETEEEEGNEGEDEDKSIE